MVAVNAYATRQELQDRLDLTVPNAALQAILDNVIEAASRAIDGWTNRRFYQVTETRYFTGEFGDLLVVDDLRTVTTLKTDLDGDRTYETSWATTDFDLEPFNAALTSRPFTQMRTTPNGVRTFPTIRKGIEIVGDWGWPAVPDAINEATLIQAARIFKRKDSVLGMMGSAEIGQLDVLPRIDPDVRELIAPFRRLTAGAI